MASGSNVYKPKLTGILIAAIALVMIVIVILISTILILAVRTGGSADTTVNTPLWTPQNGPISGPSTTPSTTPAADPGTTAPSAPGDDPVLPGANTLVMEKKQVGEGALVLIDSNHFYHRDGLIARSELNELNARQLGFEALAGNTGNYVLSKGNLYLDAEAHAAFNAMMADLAAAAGAGEVQVRNAYYYDDSLTSASNQSELESVEHSTGCVVDLELNIDGKIYPINHPTYKSKYYNWIIENGWKYGFIHVRNLSNYSTFRYIGVAHTAAMRSYSLDLPNYLTAVTAYTFNNRLKVIDGEGREWWIYYVKAEADMVAVPVYGQEGDYQISGDNREGFVVAINSAQFAS